MKVPEGVAREKDDDNERKKKEKEKQEWRFLKELQGIKEEGNEGVMKRSNMTYYYSDTGIKKCTISKQNSHQIKENMKRVIKRSRVVPQYS